MKNQKTCKRGHVSPRNKHGQCVECSRESNRSYYARYPERRAEATRRYRSKPENKQKQLERLRAWERKNPEKVRVTERRKKGLPEPTRPCPILCECCGRHSLRVSKRGRFSLHLDHDHVTGSFRGWLCNPCNLAIGMLGDDETGVRRALAYLQIVKDALPKI